jgi:hypothetical protein
MLVLALHALDVPVVGLLGRVACIQEVGDAKAPVPYAHIYTNGNPGHYNNGSQKIAKK